MYIRASCKCAHKLFLFNYLCIRVYSLSLSWECWSDVQHLIVCAFCVIPSIRREWNAKSLNTFGRGPEVAYGVWWHMAVWQQHLYVLWTGLSQTSCDGTRQPHICHFHTNMLRAKYPSPCLCRQENPCTVIQCSHIWPDLFRHVVTFRAWFLLWIRKTDMLKYSNIARMNAILGWCQNHTDWPHGNDGVQISYIFKDYMNVQSSEYDLQNDCISSEHSFSIDCGLF